MEVKTALALFFLHGVVISAVLAKKVSGPGKPTLQQCPDRGTVNTGDTVTWTCVANWNDEKSPDSYLWYRRYSNSNNTRIPDEEGKTFTKIVRPDDAGYYRCMTVIGKSESDLGFYKKLIVNGPGKPTLQQCPDRKRVNTGDTVTWTCVANSNDGESQDSYNYLWFKYYSNSRVYRTIFGEKGRTFTKNVRPGDAGYYKCKTVIGSSSSDLSLYKKLSVNGPGTPTLQQCPDRETVNTGDTVTWTCVANSSDRESQHSYKYFWYKFSYTRYWLIPNEDGRTFTKNVRPGDAGYYKCKTVIGSSSSDYSLYKKLSVNGPGTPTLQQCPDRETVNTGDTVTWTCVANSSDGVRPDSYLWYKTSGGFNYPITGEVERTFTKTVRPGNSGYYKCKTVIGSSSSDYSPNKKLSVNVPDPGPPIMMWCPSNGQITVGETLRVICLADPSGGTPTSYKLLCKGTDHFNKCAVFKSKQFAQGMIFSKEVGLSDTGEYYCRAINTAGSEDSADQTLTVSQKVTPSCPNIKPVVSLSSPASLNVNDTLNLTCETKTEDVTGIIFKWFRNDSLIKNEDMQVYEKDRVDSKDAGSYICQTSQMDKSSCSGNKVNSTTFSISIATTTPITPPERLTMKWFPDPDTRQITVGETLIVFCRAAPDGGRPASYELCRRHDGGDVGLDNCTSTFSHVKTGDDEGHGHGGMFYKSVALSDSGEYYCRAINTAGATNSSDQPLTVSGKVSEIAASFRSTKAFTKKLLDETTQEYKDMKENFEPLLQNAYKSKVASGEMKGVIITGFEKGSVIVHYKIILKVSVDVTYIAMNPAAVSKMFVDYLKDNPNEAKKYDIAPGSAGTVDVISAITATLIVILIVTVVVLVVFLIRLKRQVMEKQFAGDEVEYTAGVNGLRPPGVKVKKSNGLDTDNVYAAIGEKEPANDLYRSLGQQKRIVKPKASRENPAFETEEADYLDVVGDGGVVSPNMLASLEDGYQGNDAVYHVLESDAAVTSKKPDMAGNDADYALAGDAEWTKGGPNAAAQKPDMAGNDADYSLAGDAQWTNGGPNAAAAPTEESVYSLAQQDSAGVDDDYATPDRDDYAVLNKKKVDGAKGTKPGWADLKSKPKPNLQKPQTGKITKRDAYDNMDDYSHTYAHAPGSASADESKMAANGCQGNTNEDEEYSRLQLPILTKPRTMQNLQKSPRHHQNCGNSTPAADDNNDDYDYGSVCDVVS